MSKRSTEDIRLLYGGSLRCSDGEGATKNCVRVTRTGVEVGTGARRGSARRKQPSSAALSAELKKVAAEVRRGLRPSLDTPEGFSKHLMATIVRDVETWRDHESFVTDLFGRTGPYKRNFAALFTALAPKGILCARGLHNLPMGSAREILDLVRPGERPLESYSLNIAYAVREFAGTRWKDLRDLLPYRGMEPHEDRRTKMMRAAAEALCLREGKKPTMAALRAALPYVTGSVVIVARLTPQQARAFGDDSESGEFMEAELRVNTYPKSALERVFALSPHPIKGARPTTEAERRRYALSCYDIVTVRPDGDLIYEPLELTLHSDAVPKDFAGKRRRIRTVAEAAKAQSARARPAAKSVWYTLFQRSR